MSAGTGLKAAIESPCVRRCTLDPETRLCTGCLRSLEEIAAWGRMAPAARAAVMAVLPERSTLLRHRHAAVLSDDTGAVDGAAPTRDAARLEDL